MAVVDVILSSASADGEAAEPSDDLPYDQQENYVTRYKVQVDSPLDTSPVVLAHFRDTPSLPWYGRPLRYGNGWSLNVTCRSISTTYMEGSEGWHFLEAQFRPIANPLRAVHEIEIEYTQYSEAMDRGIFREAINGKGPSLHLKKDRLQACCNSAGDAFDPPAESERHIKIVRITKNLDAYPEAAMDWHGSINNGDFTIVKRDYKFRQHVKKYCGLLRVGSRFAISNRIPYWRTTAELWIHPRGWRKQILDQGMKELFVPGDRDKNGNIISASDVPAGQLFDSRLITDEEGNPPVSPVLLDGTGHRLKLNPADPHVFLVYSDENMPERDFSAITW